MKNVFKTIAIIGKYNNPDLRQQIKLLANFFVTRNIEVLIEYDTALHCNISDIKLIKMESIGDQVDLAVVLGGDGTMLSVSRGLVNSQIPLVGINQGRVGFLTDISSEKMIEAMDKILSGEYLLERRTLLQATIVRSNELVGCGLAMNDVVVNKSGMSRLIELEVNIDGQFVHRQRSDGLILATPTGTTAYALSAGGPILHPSLEALALVPICPHTLSNRPIAISSSSKIEITLIHADDAGIHFDGQMHMELLPGDKIMVESAENKVSLLHPAGHSHYDMLREKLNWG